VIKKFYGVVRLIPPPLTDFFLGRFWAFLDEGNSKTRLKKSRHRTCTKVMKVQSWPNKVRTYIGCLFLFFFLSPLEVRLPAIGQLVPVPCSVLYAVGSVLVGGHAVLPHGCD
jgi:hypothetical protein